MTAFLLLFCLRVLLWLVIFGWVALHLLVGLWFWIVERRDRNTFGALSGGASARRSLRRYRPSSGATKYQSIGCCDQRDKPSHSRHFDSADHEQRIRRAILLKILTKP